MMAHQFAAGDVVVLKGQSVRMTVERILPQSTMVECVWFDVENCLHRDRFDFTGLAPAFEAPLVFETAGAKKP
jgi:uncharacterized protein YodC (DUF2158 family)